MSLALYRKYRPGTFAEVRGQEHVTGPLRQALANGRLHHAYLLSGPRGCGKTSSARILARSLNCEQGPTPEPCGVCDSCVALAPNGPGSLDVIEIDAASHNGVDDARDLRDKAFFAPVSSRYKVYILDEAHMITKGAFNALLKLVEEPPEFVKFVFATTEPENVMQTIRSRTHHYPFRLMPRRDLTALLEDVVASEGITVDPAVLPLVVRAAQGSARDGLSILDQVLAGAGPGGVTRASAAALLGVTPDVLLDEVLDAFSVGDGAAVFRTVDQVMEGGHDPRRFAADVLERLRDLVILDAVPDAGEKGVLDCPPEQLARMTRQVAALGTAGLSRAADLFHAGLTEMRGTTAPRLLLELVCARVLLPAASGDDAAVLSRVERVERRLEIGGLAPPPAVPPRVAADPPASGPERHASGHPAVHPDRGPEAAQHPRPPAPPAAAAPPVAPAAASAPDAPAARAQAPVPAAAAAGPPTSAPAMPAEQTQTPSPTGASAGAPASARPEPAGQPPERTQRVAAPAADGATAWPTAATPGGGAGGPGSAPAAGGEAQAPGAGAPDPSAPPEPARPQSTDSGPGGLDAAAVRRAWDDVLAAVKPRRVTHTLLLECQVGRLEGTRLELVFTTPTLARKFQEGAYVEHLHEALHQVLGVDLQVVCTSSGGAPAGPATGGRAPEPRARRTAPPEPPPYETFAPGDEATEDDPAAPAPERGDDAALRLVQQSLGGTVLGTSGD